MHKISRKLEYSLIALKYIKNKRGELTSAKEISDRFQCSFDALSRVLQLMVLNQILKSEQGIQGGYALNKNLSELSFFDLIQVINRPIHLTRCLSGESCELGEQCDIYDSIHWLNWKLIEFYRSISVECLLDGNEFQGKKFVFNDQILNGSDINMRGKSL